MADERWLTTIILAYVSTHTRESKLDLRSCGSQNMGVGLSTVDGQASSLSSFFYDHLWLCAHLGLITHHLEPDAFPFYIQTLNLEAMSKHTVLAIHCRLLNP